MSKTLAGVRSGTTDDGFSLIEVIVAMFIIMLVMTALIGVLLSSLTTVTQARQRQTATALATQSIERLRALPYDDVTKANGTTIEPGLTHVVPAGTGYDFVPAMLSGVNEPLVVNDWSGHWEDQSIDGVTYRTQTYVTRPPVTASGEQTYNLTAVVSWTSPVSKGTRTTVERSAVYSPAGCLSTAQSPFAAPCQAYFTASAGAALGGIAVANALDSTLPVEGFASGHVLNLDLARLSTSLLLEQTATATAGAQTTSARSEGSSPSSSGGVSASAAVDSDPASAEGQSQDTTLSAQSSGTQTLTGTAGTLSLKPSIGDSGRVAAAIAAPSTICTSSTGTGLTTGSPSRSCASARVEPEGGDAHLTWTPDPALGLPTTPVPVLTLAPSGAPWRAVAANLTSGNTGACTTASGPTALGCAHAAAERELGDVRIGDPGTGAGVPAGWDPAYALVHVDDLAETVRAEDGTGSGAPVGARTGTLRVWNGAGYTSVTLAGAGAQTIALPDTTLTYSGTAGTVHVTYQGTVQVQPPTTQRTPVTRTGNAVTDCKAEACVTRVDAGGGVVVALTVTVSTTPFDPASVDPPLARFALTANLGGLVAQATYKAAPNA